MQFASALAIILAAVLGAPQGANIINGDFEAGSGLPGWTTTGAGPLGGGPDATAFELSRDVLPPVAPDWVPVQGDFFASLWSTDSAGASISTLSQSFDGVAGTLLKFDYFFDSAVPPLNEPGAPRDRARSMISWAGGASSQVLFEHNFMTMLNDDGNVGWTEVTFVLPVDDTYTLQFLIEDQTLAGSSYVSESILGVDNVVPEPSTVALIAIGWFVLRRRRV